MFLIACTCRRNIGVLNYIPETLITLLRFKPLVCFVNSGAKPPKKEYVNYKDLMAKRKEEKKKEKQEKEMMISKSVLHKVGKSKSKNKSAGNDVGHFLSGYGKV